MAQTSVAQFAGELKVQPAVLLEQLQAVGVHKRVARGPSHRAGQDQAPGIPGRSPRFNRAEDGRSRSPGSRPPRSRRPTRPARRAPSRWRGKKRVFVKREVGEAASGRGSRAGRGARDRAASCPRPNLRRRGRAAAEVPVAPVAPWWRGRRSMRESAVPRGRASPRRRARLAARLPRSPNDTSATARLPSSAKRSAARCGRGCEGRRGAGRHDPATSRRPLGAKAKRRRRSQRSPSARGVTTPASGAPSRLAATARGRRRLAPTEGVGHARHAEAEGKRSRRRPSRSVREVHVPRPSPSPDLAHQDVGQGRRKSSRR